MGIFSFLRKKRIQKQGESVSLGTLARWLDCKNKEKSEKQEEFLNSVKKIITQLVSELKAEIDILENVDVETKKVNSKIKLIVKENLRNYIDYLKKVIEKLEEINCLDGMVDKINSIFEDFRKKSQISYEKITFIVGKEMQATKDSIKKFFKDLEKILKYNKEEIEEIEAIQSISKENKRYRKFEESKEKILEALKEDAEKLKNLETTFKETSDKILSLKNYEKYALEEEKRQEVGAKRKELEEFIEKLHRKVDFRTLSAFYHKFEIEMEQINQYREEFKQTLVQLGIDTLSNLLSESKALNKDVGELIDKIKNMEKEIFEVTFEDLGFENMKNEADKINSELKILENDKFTKEKKLRNLDEDVEKLVENLKGKFGKLGIDFN